MEWEKAKSIIIVFLALINILLGFLLYKSGLKYTLSDERRQNITAILSKNGISLETELLSGSRPLRKMEFSPYSYDDQEMLGLFTQSKVKEKKPYDDFKITTFILESETLSISQSKVIYERETTGGGGGAISPLKTCQEFLSSMGEKSKGYELDYISAKDGTGSVDFRQKVNGYTIYGNYIKFVLEDYEIKSIEYSCGEPMGFFGEPSEIYSCDEALFTFVSAMRKERPENIVIKGLDMIYLSQEQIGGRIIAVPCYRVAYSPENNPEQEEHALINAYTNKVEYPSYL